MIESIAAIYVNFIEPLMRVLLIGLVVVLILGIINFIRDPKAKENFIKTIITIVFKALKWLLIGFGVMLKGLIDMLHKAIKVIFAAFRDFFNSKI